VTVPTDLPALDLPGLFRDPDMFDSRSSWAAAGFQVVNSKGKILVAQHPSASGLLFKKYLSSVSQKVQHANYTCRLEGSQRLRAFAADRGLTRIIVPHKWIMPLPREFSHSTILIAEQLEVLGSAQTAAAYQHIDMELLRQLCVVLFHFRGMDSNSSNLPFLTGGRIGLVDTEHWDRGTSKDYLHHVREHMSSESRKAAKKIFHQLRDGSEDGAHRHRSVIIDEDDSSDDSSDSSSSSFS